MAIYRLQHGLIGRTKQRPGTAAAHVRYILRSSAATWIAVHVPISVSPDRDGVSQWMAHEEKRERKNGHLLDKIIVTLPRELVHESRHALMETFVRELTQERVPYVAAIHDRIGSKDEYHPHGHVAIRDRDFVTGRRVLKTTERGKYATAETVGSTLWMRAVWERCVNRALEEAGLFQRVDRRSYAEQGLTRRPRGYVPRGTWNRLVSDRAIA